MSKLYVGGSEIGVSIDDNDIEDAFSKFGRISKVWVARKPPGFAFVEYEDSRDADDAVAEMNGKELRGRDSSCTLRVEFSRRGERRGGGGDIEMKPGDWKCDKCGVVNFARRTECFRCHAPKGRDDRYDRYDRYDRDYRRDRYRRSRSRSPRSRSGGRDRRRDRRDDSRDRGRDRRDDSRDRRRDDSRERRDDSRDRRRGDSRDRREDSRGRGDSRDRGDDNDRRD